MVKTRPRKTRATTRRDFLKTAALAAVGAPLVLPAPLAGRPQGPLASPYVQRHAYSCIVIGAGLSGLAAAYALKQARWNVTVLEARERIGGRVSSFSFKENPELVCELGGEWVGESHERMKALCHDCGITLTDHRFQAWLMRDGVVKRPGQWDFSPQAKTSFEKFRKTYHSYRPEDRLRLDQYDWWTWLEEIGFTQDDLLLRDLQDSTDFGETIRMVSAYAAAAEYFESSPANEMDYKMEGGNSRLVQALAARVGNDAIHTGVPVWKIKQRAGSLTVTAGGRTFVGDACICTLPARTLDKISFDPPLPSAHSAAAEKLQYARIIKNCVLFNERFWGAEDFSLVSDVTSHYYFHSTKAQPGQQGILCSYAIGEKADVLAAQNSLRRNDIITRDLLPLNERAPALARNIKSVAWQRDEYTRGAYAFYRPGQWFTLRPVLQEPHGKVLFAGEHLADWQGFMEGAVVTGEAAAQALIGKTRARRAA
ncbi:MAG: NAD(P)/FAD-dependent oxidoreductase [Acidobacteriota bacterium]|nr:NAD(P)/FAD-dependent oxidoreductase [Acidobacteriota bacterium]